MISRAGASTYGWWLLIVVGLWGSTLLSPTYAQDADTRYTFMLRNVALDQALDEFARTTGANVAYTPSLIAGKRTFCTTDGATPEKVMRCILRDTGLDYYRLSSGTYVLVPSVAEAPRHGSVRGFVVDATSGLPLPNAYVYLSEAGIGTFSNDAGHFTFSSLRHGAYTASTSHLGYRERADTVWVQPEAVIHLTVALQPVPLQMEPVVIDGFLQQRPSRRLGTGEVDEELLLRAPTPGAATALQVLDLVPGVWLDEATANLQIQEGAPGDHQLRLDGVPVFLPVQAHGLIGMFSPFALKRLTVHKAGFGAKYGSYTSGVVLADHKLQPAHSRWLDLQVDPLSIHAYAGREWTPTPRQRLHAMAAVRQSLWSWYQPPPLHGLLERWGTPDYFLVDAPVSLRNPDALGGPREETRPDPSLGFLDVHAAMRWQHNPWHSVETSFYQGTNHLAHEADPARPASIADRYEWTNQTGQVRLNTIFGARLLGSLQLRASRYQLTHRYQLIDSLRVIYNGPVFIRTREVIEQPVDDDNEVQEVAAELAVDYAIGRHHYLEATIEGAYTSSRFDIVAANALAYVQEVLRPPVDSFATQRRQIAHRHANARWAGFLSDRITLSATTTAELGTRVTWLPEHGRSYVEPRMALRYDADGAAWGTWSGRVAVGLYRQFTNQLDVSSANVGALLPTVRFWAPVDTSLHPAKAYHAAGDVLIRLRSGWDLRLETFVKVYAHTPTFLYAPPDSNAVLSLTSPQRAFVEMGRGYAHGVTTMLRRTSGPFTVQADASWSRARWRTPSRFENRYVPVPWEEPFRLQLRMGWQPEDGIGASLRGRGIWSRSWGFRQAYYDYFASDERTRTFGAVDLSQPEQHRLPPLLRLDAGVQYTRRMGPMRLLLRIDVLNVLDRKNVLEWLLRFDQDQQTFVKDPRFHLPRTVLISLRTTW